MSQLQPAENPQSVVGHFLVVRIIYGSSHATRSSHSPVLTENGGMILSPVRCIHAHVERRWPVRIVGMWGVGITNIKSRVPNQIFKYKIKCGEKGQEGNDVQNGDKSKVALLNANNGGYDSDQGGNDPKAKSKNDPILNQCYAG